MNIKNMVRGISIDTKDSIEEFFLKNLFKLRLEETGKYKKIQSLDEIKSGSILLNVADKSIDGIIPFQEIHAKIVWEGKIMEGVYSTGIYYNEEVHYLVSNQIFNMSGIDQTPGYKGPKADHRAFIFENTYKLFLLKE